MNKRIFSLFNAETIEFHILVLRNSISDVTILSRECLTKLENYGNYRVCVCMGICVCVSAAPKSPVFSIIKPLLIFGAFFHA